MDFVSPVIVPAVIAGFAWLISFRLWNRKAAAPYGHWGGVAALALGYLSAQVLLISWPPWPAASALHWLFYLTIVAGVIALGGHAWDARWWVRAPIESGLLVAFAWSQLRPLVKHTWAAWESTAWLAGLVLFGMAACECVEGLARRRPGVSLPWVLWCTASTAALCLVLTGSALLGQLAGAVAGVLGAAVVLAYWGPTLSLAHGAILLFVLIIHSLLWQGVFYSQLPLTAALLVALAPFAGWVGESTRVRSWASWRLAGLRMACVLAPLLIAVWLAYRFFVEAGVNDYSY